MFEHELLLLGLLKENPQHGYEIKTKIKEILSLSAGVKLKSIYYPLRVLEKKGFVAKRVTKPTRRPERIVYALTPKGQERFRELLNKSFLNLKRPQFSLDLSLYFLPYMDPAVSRRRLRGRLLMLNRISRGLEELVNSPDKKRPLSLQRILEHNLEMLKAEAKFLSGLIDTI